MTADRQTVATEKPIWWCNFCNFKTEDQAVYLKHSCVDELKKQEPSPRSGDRSHCS